MSVFTTIVCEIFLCLVQTIFFKVSIYVSVYLFVFIACSYLIEFTETIRVVTVKGKMASRLYGKGYGKECSEYVKVDYGKD